MNAEIIAKKFLDSNGIFRFWRGRFYHYKDNYYSLVAPWNKEDDMDVIITKYLIKNIDQPNVTKSSVNNILLCVKAMSRIDVLANNWIDIEIEGETCCFNNGLLHKYPNGSEVLTAHSPNFFTLNKLPYDYDKDAKCPRWLQYLNETMESDPGRIQLLQQWCKYVLSNDVPTKFLILHGDAGTGKDTFINVLTRLVGTENVSNEPLSEFGNRFSLINTLDKKLNAITESSKELGKYDEERLKAYTGGGRMSFEPKYGGKFSAFPTAKVMMATNVLPRFQDKTNALWQRMRFCRFDVPFRDTEREDTGLAEKLYLELSGIYNWAQKADISKGIINPETSKICIQEYKDTTNPAGIFLKEYYEYNKFSSLPIQKVYDAYVAWCDDNGHKALNSINFGYEVKRAFPKVERQQKHRNGERPYDYEGLKRISDTDYVDVLARPSVLAMAKSHASVEKEIEI